MGYNPISIIVGTSGGHSVSIPSLPTVSLLSIMPHRFVGRLAAATGQPDDEEVGPLFGDGEADNPFDELDLVPDLNKVLADYLFQDSGSDGGGGSETPGSPHDNRSSTNTSDTGHSGYGPYDAPPAPSMTITAKATRPESVVPAASPWPSVSTGGAGGHLPERSPRPEYRNDSRSEYGNPGDVGNSDRPTVFVLTPLTVGGTIGGAFNFFGPSAFVSAEVGFSITSDLQLALTFRFSPMVGIGSYAGVGAGFGGGFGPPPVEGWAFPIHAEANVGFIEAVGASVDFDSDGLSIQKGYVRLPGIGAGAMAAAGPSFVYTWTTLPLLTDEPAADRR